MHRAHLLAVHRILADHPDIAHRLIDHHGTPSAVMEAIATGATSATDMPEHVLAAIATARSDAARTLADALASGVTVVTYADTRYPQALHDLGQRKPLALFVRGNEALLSELATAVTVTGARAASAYGVTVAADLAEELASHGHMIVTGGGFGIDAAATRAALRTKTVPLVFVATGVNAPHPVAHAELFDTIVARGGAIVSEHGLRTPPSLARVKQRARLLAATAATVIVEAAHRSSSLPVAAEARTLGRPVGAVPGSVLSAASYGTHALLRDGHASMVTRADDVLGLLAR